MLQDGRGQALTRRAAGKARIEPRVEDAGTRCAALILHCITDHSSLRVWVSLLRLRDQFEYCFLSSISLEYILTTAAHIIFKQQWLCPDIYAVDSYFVFFTSESYLITKVLRCLGK